MYYSEAVGWDTLRGREYPDGPFPPDGRFDGASIGNCSANIGYRYVYNGNQTAAKIFCRFGDLVTPYAPVDTAVVQGQGFIIWYRGFNADSRAFCGGSGNPCFTFSGDGYSIQVVPFPADMSLTSDLAVIDTSTGPQYTTFRVKVTPGIVESHSEVTIVQSWVWAPDSGASQSIPANCVGQKTCEFFPARSGTMTVNAIVNGVLHQSSKHIDVGKPCPPSGDALLDQKRVHDALEQLLKDSGPERSLDTARREKVMYVYQDGDSLVIERGTDPEIVGLANCRSTINPNESGSRKLLGVFHSHPYKPGYPRQEAQETVNCGGLSGAYYTGGSDVDWSWVNLFNSPPRGANEQVPLYVIDTRYVHRLTAGPGTSDPRQWKANTKSWEHDPNKDCFKQTSEVLPR
jgi:hypothetical protein